MESEVSVWARSSQPKADESPRQTPDHYFFFGGKVRKKTVPWPRRPNCPTHPLQATRPTPRHQKQLIRVHPWLPERLPRCKRAAQRGIEMVGLDFFASAFGRLLFLKLFVFFRRRVLLSASISTVPNKPFPGALTPSLSRQRPLPSKNRYHLPSVLIFTCYPVGCLFHVQCFIFGFLLFLWRKMIPVVVRLPGYKAARGRRAASSHFLLALAAGPDLHGCTRNPFVAH